MKQARVCVLASAWHFMYAEAMMIRRKMECLHISLLLIVRESGVFGTVCLADPCVTAIGVCAHKVEPHAGYISVGQCLEKHCIVVSVGSTRNDCL